MEIETESAAAATDAEALAAALSEALLSAGFRGDVDGDGAHRAAMSTDNSIYQIRPELVVAPVDAADVALLVRVASAPRFAGLALTARGAGTGTNGQSLNSGVIVDFRRHMRRLLRVDLDAGWADVEPGMVLDELNAEIADSGMFFAPNTSTSNRCTIGGMVATDASGKGSRIYGKTADNVLGLQAVTRDGLVLDSLAPDEGIGHPMLEEIAAACDAGRAPLLARVPALARRFSGYDLERARPDKETLEWWRLFLGAEGTLGLVTRVRVKLVRKPRFNRLAVVAFASFEAALSASQALLELAPLAIECLDEWVQRLAEEAGLLRDLPPALRGSDGTPPVYDFIEFAGADEAALDRQLSLLAESLSGLAGVVGYHVAADAAEIGRLWSVRSASVGLLGNSRTRRVPVPFVEDCAVPPAHLVAFVREFSAILAAEGMVYGIYGHADVGCLHVRPALDIDDALDRERLKRVSDAVYALVKRHGGIFWGEHGKGVRGEYLEDFVGPEAFEAFRRIKRAFDPQTRFNPGKLVGLEVPVRRIATTPFRMERPAADDSLATAFACNGNAACLNYDSRTAMCPSFKATNDLVHSPKGRAEALKAWHAAERGSAKARTEIEEATFRTLDNCLGCNACASACPVHVGIPEMKSHFLAAYHLTHRRRAADLAGIWLERFSPALAVLRPLLRLSDAVGAQAGVSRLFGLVDTPRASARGLRQLGYPVLRPEALRTCVAGTGTVLVAADAFTALFDTPAIGAVCAGLAALGYRPVLLSLPPGGKAAHVKGARASFLRQARRLHTALVATATTGLPIVGVDPAFVLMLREEYARAGLAPPVQVRLVQEFLAESRREGFVWPRPARALSPRRLFLHCTESARGSAASRDWSLIFRELGLEVTAVATGCCGMAGLYGHEKRHLSLSRRLFDMSWRGQLAGQDTVLATGFSCRCQVSRFTEQVAVHPMALITEAFS